MPRNGSGTYNLPALNPVVSNTTISSTWANNTMSDLASALTASIAVDGQTPPTANLPMGGFKHTNAAAATATTDYLRADQGLNSSLQYLTSVTGTNTITGTAPVTPAAYVAGQTFRFVAAGANTGAVTLNINGLGAQAVTKSGATPLVTGDILSGAIVEVVYDGTRFQLSSAGYTINTNRILGRTTAGTGPVEQLTVGAGLLLSAGSLAGEAATQTAQGIIEIATNAEVIAGTDTTRAITPAGFVAAKINQQAGVVASGAAVAFTGIPSWAKRVVIHCNGISSTGGEIWLLRLGTGGGPTWSTTNYFGTASSAANGNVWTVGNHSGAFSLRGALGAASWSASGQLILQQEAAGGNWTLTGQLGQSDSATHHLCAGIHATGAALTGVQLLAGGSDTWDNGIFTIAWE